MKLIDAVYLMLGSFLALNLLTALLEKYDRLSK